MRLHQKLDLDVLGNPVHPMWGSVAILKARVLVWLTYRCHKPEIHKVRSSGQFHQTAHALRVVNVRDACRRRKPKLRGAQPVQVSR